jgi:hypothetical protein
MNHDFHCAKFGINYTSLPLKLTIVGFFMWKKYLDLLLEGILGKIWDNFTRNAVLID